MDTDWNIYTSSAYHTGTFHQTGSFHQLNLEVNMEGQRKMQVFQVVVVDRIKNQILYNNIVIARDEKLALANAELDEITKAAINNNVAAVEARAIMSYAPMTTDEMIAMSLEGDVIKKLAKS